MTIADTASFTAGDYLAETTLWRDSQGLAFEKSVTSFTGQRNTPGISYTVINILDHGVGSIGTACVILRYPICCVTPSVTLWDQWDSAYGAPLTPRHRTVSRSSRGTVLYSNTFLGIFIKSTASRILLRSEHVVSSDHGNTH